MLDLNFIRQNPQLVKKNSEERKISGSVVDSWLLIDKVRREIISEVDKIREEKKKGSKNITDEDRVNLKRLKLKLAELEDKLEEVNKTWSIFLNQIPNIHSGDVPVGMSESDNKIEFQSKQITKFDFRPKDHVELMISRGLIDFERGAKVSGSQFYFLQGDIVLLEMAIMQFVLDLVIKNGYIPLHTPDLARSRYYLGTGYSPRGDEAQTYEIKDDDLGLVATAEVTTAGYHADEILDIYQLPKKYISISHCFRKEAGAYGKYSRGLYRVHQFTKMELFVYSESTDSNRYHQEILDIEKEIMEKLKVPFRVLNICTGDLGGMASKKYDIDVWMPGRGDYGEVTSTSNCTDYQARNLNIRYREKDGTLKYVHMLNGTAVAIPRLLIAIVENYQQSDGSILVPKVLQNYMLGNKKVI